LFKPESGEEVAMSIPLEEIQLTTEQKRRIAEIADRAGRPWPEVLSEALRAYRPYVSKNGNGVQGQSAYDVLMQDGVLGIADDTPPDLSTNPKYMEGFGE